MYAIVARILLSLLLITAVPAVAQMDVRDLAVYEDLGGTEVIATIGALPAAAFSPRPNGLSEGFTRSVHWLRFSAQASPGESGDWWLEIHPGYLDDVRLFESDLAHPGDFIERRTGDMLPFAEREAPYRGFLFRIRLSDSEARTFHLRLQTTSTSLMMIKLWPTTRFAAAVLLEYALLGGVMGLLGIILSINLIYWLQQREAINLHYLSYIASVLASSLIVQGFAAQFLLPDCPARVNDLQNIASSLMTAAAGRLYQSVLLVDRRQRVLWILYNMLTYLPLLSLLAIPLGYFTEAQRLVISYATLMAPVSLGRSLQLLRNKAAGGTLLVIVTMSSVVAITFSLIQISGGFSGNFIILHAFLIGSVFNVIALHLVIGARARAEKIFQQEMIEMARLNALKAEREMQAREEQAHFISMITHEIKTPLAGIAAASDALEILNGESTPEVVTRIERIRRNVKRIDGLFVRYLQVDRMDNAQTAPVFAEHALHEVVSRAVGQFTGSTQRLQCELGDDVRVTCDADLVATAILN
ncbi:MAG: sensor histidine kinase, partial [Rhodoferax sp.]